MTTASENVKSSVRKNSATSLREQRRQEAAKLQADIQAKAKKVIENTHLASDPEAETLSVKVDLPKVASHASVKTAAEQKAEFEAERRRQVAEEIQGYQPDFNGEGLTLKDLRNTLRSVKAEANKKATTPEDTATASVDSPSKVERLKARRERLVAQINKFAPAALEGLDTQKMGIEDLRTLRDTTRQAFRDNRAANKASRQPREKKAKVEYPICIECGEETGKHAHAEGTVFCSWKCGHTWAMKQTATQKALNAHLKATSPKKGVATK